MRVLRHARIYFLIRLNCSVYTFVLWSDIHLFPKEEPMRVSHRNLLTCVFAILLISLAATGQQKTQAADDTPRYRNSKLSIDDRVADLLSRMTLEEKVGQIAPTGKPASVIDPTGTFTNETAQATLTRWWDPDLEFPAKRAAILRNGLQRYSREIGRAHV